MCGLWLMEFLWLKLQAVELGIWFMVQVHSVGSGRLCLLGITVRSGCIAAPCFVVLTGQSANDECHLSVDLDRLCSDLFIARNTHLAPNGIIVSIIPLRFRVYVQRCVRSNRC